MIAIAMVEKSALSCTPAEREMSKERVFPVFSIQAASHDNSNSSFISLLRLVCCLFNDITNAVDY